MKVRCISNARTAVPENYRDLHVGGKDFLPDLHITVGKDYVVYALALQKHAQVWYYISDDDEHPYPLHYPAPMFQVIDSRFSRYWRFAFTPQHLDHVALCAFEDWVLDPYFYDRLTDVEEKEVSKFKIMKTLIDSEGDQFDS